MKKGNKTFTKVNSNAQEKSKSYLLHVIQKIIRKIQQTIKVSVSSIQQHNREVVNSNFTINQTLT